VDSDEKRDGDRKRLDDIARRIRPKTVDFSRRDVWELEVGWWPAVVDAGLKPVRIQYYGESDPPGAYMPREFVFDYPPSREDFLAVMLRLPWMQGTFGSERFLKALEASDWPMIDSLHKSSSSDLLEGDKVVGSLRVSRGCVWQNRQIHVPYVPQDCVHRVVHRLPKDIRESADYQAMLGENWMREQAVLRGLDHIGEDLVRECLEVRGVVKPRRRKADPVGG
jgi:hypothetical protein